MARSRRHDRTSSCICTIHTCMPCCSYRKHQQCGSDTSVHWIVSHGNSSRSHITGLISGQAQRAPTPHRRANMTWYDTLTSTPALIAGAVGVSALLYIKATQKPSTPTKTRRGSTFTSESEPFVSGRRSSTVHAAHAAQDAKAKPAMPGVMSPPAAELAPPKVNQVWSPLTPVRPHSSLNPSPT